MAQIKRFRIASTLRLSLNSGCLSDLFNNQHANSATSMPKPYASNSPAHVLSLLSPFDSFFSTSPPNSPPNNPPTNPLNSTPCLSHNVPIPPFPSTLSLHPSDVHLAPPGLSGQNAGDSTASGVLGDVRDELRVDESVAVDLPLVDAPLVNAPLVDLPPSRVANRADSEAGSGNGDTDA